MVLCIASQWLVKKMPEFLARVSFFSYFCDMDYKRNKHRREWWQEHHEEKGLERHPSMKRRKPSHDYSSRCIYMITLNTVGRRPVLGTLRAGDDSHPEPWLEPSALGVKVLSCWQRIAEFYPEVKLLAVQLMPEHMHGVLFVTRPMSKHLGTVLNGFKAGCNKHSREITGGVLWESGYNDMILKGEGQLERMKHYVHDNPRRGWIKRHNRDFFTIKNDVTIGDRQVATVGNQFLLEHPWKIAVRCSRSIKSDEAIAQEVERFMAMATDGAVLVSPSISPAEKKVMRAAFDAGYPLIVLLENGFSPLWKPGGGQFDACADGRLLLVAPWPHHNEYKKITRGQCQQLNDLAREIASL